MMESPITKKVLVGVRELLAERSHWTKGADARNSDMKRTWCRSNDATCWCLQGAIEKVASEVGVTYGRGMLYVERAIYECGFKGSIIAFNDNPMRLHSDVIQVVDKAIELSSGEFK